MTRLKGSKSQVIEGGFLVCRHKNVLFNEEDMLLINKPGQSKNSVRQRVNQKFINLY